MKLTPALFLLCLAGLAACDSTPTQKKLAGVSAGLPSAAAATAPAVAPAPVLDPNEVLAARVRRALDTEKNLETGGIDVTAFEGNITLWGTTSTVVESKRAEAAAAKIEGVKSVDNRIAVVKGS
jgi:hyperosmotically inducible protein